MSRFTEADAAERRDTMTVSANRLTPLESLNLLTGLVRFPGLLAQARQHLTPAGYGGLVRRRFVEAIYAHYDRHRDCPSAHALLAAAHAATVGVLGEDTHAQEIAELVTNVYVTASPQDEPYYRQLLSRAIDDYTAFRVAMMQANVRMTPTQRLDVNHLTEILTEGQRKARAVLTRPAHMAIPLSSAPFENAMNVPTGIDYLDRSLEDGACQVAKTYGLLGPYGGGKTTLGVQILTSTAAGLHQRQQEGFCVYFAYEDYRTVAIKTLKQLTGIRRQSLRELLAPANRRPDGRIDLDVLGTAGMLEPYELEHYDRTGTPHDRRPGERERFHRAVEVNGRIAIFDMDDPDQPEVGRGGVDEIDADLEFEVGLRRQPVRLVVVDYLKVMADRTSAAQKNEKEGDLKKHSDRAMNDLKRLAKKYNCVVWVLQQMNAEANRKAEGGSTHHIDSAGSTAFAESVWSCFTLGRAADIESDGVRQLRQTKSRDTALARPTVLKFNGWDDTLVEDTDYRVANGRIVRDGLSHIPVGRNGVHRTIDDLAGDGD